MSSLFRIVMKTTRTQNIIAAAFLFTANDCLDLGKADGGRERIALLQLSQFTTH